MQASVKVMRSYDYCHFEVALSAEDVFCKGENEAERRANQIAIVDELRKDAAILVAQDEFICLVAATLVSLTNNGLKTNPHVVHKIVRYKRNAAPGDTLIAQVKLTGKKGRFLIFSGDIRNQRQELVAEYERIVGAV